MNARGVAVVTGASRGIGRALALELARRGFNVVATMRDPSDGQTLLDEADAAGLALTVERLDVTEPSTFTPPSELRLLVSNAFAPGPFTAVEATTSDQWREVFETNVMGPVELIRRSIPTLRSNGGVICVVGSTAMLHPMPFYGVYRASKAAMSALCESLRVELTPFGIRVIEVLPGAIDTDALRQSMAFEPPEAIRLPLYRTMGERQFEIGQASRAFIRSASTAASRIADAILRDDGPMRYGTDDVSEAMIEGWRGQSDEQSAAVVLAAYGVVPGRIDRDPD